MRQLIRQTLAQLRAQRMLTTISIVGTALAIFLIMVVVMLHQVQVAEFAPVSKRDRMLHAQWGTIEVIDRPEYCSNGGMSVKSAQRLGDIKEAEAVSIYRSSTSNANVKVAGQPSFGTDMRTSDENYWRVFDFTFLSGKPYDKAAVDAGQHDAVIDASTARRLFGTTDAVGREFLMDYTPFRVCGVVRDVSTLADGAFSHIWIPYSAVDLETWNNGLMGDQSITILAKKRDDFDMLRQAYERNMDSYNSEVVPTGWRFKSLNRPYDQEKATTALSSNIEPDVEAARRNRYIVYLILLIVPAINLSGMTESRMRQRVEEIGVRRAFGSTRSGILSQLFCENLLITVVAGLIGWLSSVVFAFLCSTFLFMQGYSSSDTLPSIDINMLVQPATFVWALFFCFVLNTLSSGLPAWKASRTNIVNAINRH